MYKLGHRHELQCQSTPRILTDLLIGRGRLVMVLALEQLHYDLDESWTNATWLSAQTFASDPETLIAPFLLAGYVVGRLIAVQ